MEANTLLVKFNTFYSKSIQMFVKCLLSTCCIVLFLLFPPSKAPADSRFWLRTVKTSTNLAQHYAAWLWKTNLKARHHLPDDPKNAFPLKERAAMTPPSLSSPSPVDTAGTGRREKWDSLFSRHGGRVGADKGQSTARASWCRTVWVVSKQRVGGESGWETTTSG